MERIIRINFFKKIAAFIGFIVLPYIGFSGQSAQAYEICPGCLVSSVPLFQNKSNYQRYTEVLAETGITTCGNGQSYQLFGYATTSLDIQSPSFRDYPVGGFSSYNTCIAAVVFMCSGEPIYVPVFGVHGGPNGCFPGAPFSLFLGGLPDGGSPPITTTTSSTTTTTMAFPPTPSPASVPSPKVVATPTVSNPACSAGSIIQVDNLVLGEKIPIVGTNFDLVYFSDRSPARVDDYFVNIPLVGESTTGIAQVNLRVNIAGKIFEQSFPPSANLNYTYAWNGYDVNNLPVSASASANITVSYIGFGGDVVSQSYSTPLGHFQAWSVGLGGWTLSPHHFYDVNSKYVHYGYGGSRYVNAIAQGENYLVTSEDGSEAYIFNSQGKHLQTKDTLIGRTKYSFEYDIYGYLVAVVNKFGKRLTITKNQNTVAIKSFYGQTTKAVYSSDGWLSSVTNPNNETYSLVMNPGGLLTQFTKPNGKASFFSYDSRGYLLKDSGYSGNFKQYSKSVSPSGATLISEYTALGRRTDYVIRSSQASSSRISQAPTGEVQSVVDSQLGQSTNVSSIGDNLTTRSIADQRFGDMSPAIEATTRSITNTNFIGTTSSEQQVTLSSSSDLLAPLYLKNTVTVHGDSTKVFKSEFFGDQLKKVNTSAEGRQSETIINNFGLIASSKIGTLERTNIQYDVDGRPTRISSGARSSQIVYDNLGRVGSAIDSQGLVTKYTYDLAGRKNAITRPDGQVIAFTYDAAGNLTSVKPPQKKAYGFTYNDFDLMAGALPPSIGTQSWTSTVYKYNLDKQLTQIINPDNSVLNFSYESSTGRQSSLIGTDVNIQMLYKPNSSLVSKISNSQGVVLNYDYVGKLLTSEVTEGPIASKVVYNYKQNMSLDSVEVQGSVNIPYEFDKDGLLTKVGSQAMTRDENGLIKAVSLGQVSNTMSYNSFGELLGDSYKYQNKTLYSYTVKRDASGRIIEKTDLVKNLPIKTSFEYDKLGRLSLVKVANIPVERYEYDSNGNRIKGRTLIFPEKGVYDDQDRLVSYNGNAYTYNKAGALLSKTNILKKVINYKYDQLGNLLKVTIPKDNKVIDYIVDGSGRRIGKKINGVLTKGFVYQGSQLVGEIDKSGNLIKRFVYGTKINSPDYMIYKNIIYRIISNHVGTPLLVIDTASGKIAAESIYGVFGERVLDSNPDLIPFGFAGGLEDNDTGLIRFGARDYDPEVGRWTSKDPILFNGASSNLYSYALNNPVNLIDPSGLKSRILSWGDQFHRLLEVDNPNSPTGKTYIELVPGDSNNIGIVDGSPASVNITNSYASDAVFIEEFSTNALQDAELISLGQTYQFMANQGAYQYQLIGGTGNSGNCRDFVGDLLRTVGAK